VGSFANTKPAASRSTGAPRQTFYVYFPPVVPKSEAVYVGGQRWSPIQDLGRAGRSAHVFQFNPVTGQIRFGNGEHGAVPPAGDSIRVSYQSGPHGGFVEF
jgi:alpha-L-arabinofuranosidase